ncbi:MAG: redox-sensitive transcriptional activator SoxR [Kineosporiaceae bacterium]
MDGDTCDDLAPDLLDPALGEQACADHELSRECHGLPRELTVGQLAERAAVSVSALHFFERQGLLTSTRTAGNQRRYRRDALRRVAVIRAAQRAGIPLKELAELFATLPEGRAPGRAEWAQLSAQWHERLQARLEHLTRLRDELGQCIGCGCLSLDRCALANPRDLLNEGGARPGSRLVWAEPT